MAQDTATESDVSNVAPSAGSNVGVSAGTSFVYVALATSLAARPLLKARALTVVVSVSVSDEAYNVLVVVGSVPSSV